jgi:TldD protein
MKLEDSKDLAEHAVRRATASGASYAEARIQSSKERMFVLKNGEPQPAILVESYGIGLRVVCRGALAFSATNTLDRAAVNDLTERTVKLARAASMLLKKPVTLDRARAEKRKWAAEEKDRIENASTDWLRGILVEMESRIGGGKPGVDIQGRLLAISADVEEKFFVNTDGARVQSRVPRLGVMGTLTALANGGVTQRRIQAAESGGLEVAERAGFVRKVEEEAKTLGRVLRATAPPPTDVVDVILSPELSGIAAHESVGHPQEADRILGREGAQAGESYLKSTSLGERVGSSEANVSDDPTITHSFGFCPVDDEGVEGKKRLLIKDGVVSDFLHNRETAAELGVASNGSSRASSFDVEPIVRMSNTFVEPGSVTFEELVRQVKHGIYFKSFTEWNIDDKRFNQRYVGFEAYSIERGEMGGLIRSPVLEITTPRLWGSVRERSNRLEFDAAICGKGDPQQGVPVWTGGPDTLLAGIRLGAR